jgi:16S rRNA processing protein RimM
VIRVGQVMGAFGIQGAVKVRALTDFPDRYAPGATLLLDGAPRQVEWSRPHGGELVVKFTHVTSRSQAETLNGRLLEVADEELHALPEGRWYHHQLVGLAVGTEGGRRLGTLTDVVSRPANDIWVVRDDQAEVLVPAIRDAVLEVDLAAGRVTVADWLLDVEDA